MVEGEEGEALEALRSLHWAHLLAVPFENLSVHNGETIQLDYDKLYDKIVRRRRGGFCYENNGCFAWLLRQLGYQVSLMSASVFQQGAQGGRFGPEYDHLVLMVHIGKKRWLADVGFGSSYPDLLDFDTRDEQVQVTGRHRVLPDILLRGSGVYVYWQWMPPPGSSVQAPGEWQPRHRFCIRPKQLEDFRQMCTFHQSSPESFFRKGLLVSRLRGPEEGGGTITLTDSKLIVYTADTDERTEELIDSQERFNDELQKHFGISEPG
ncbi:Arylamine N-acetyltransferase [Klebsormidium nitens]|uniref:Arylamine N-acetyltransferase n=1 Tax=Klebsormidium nitens TaxID=105231 RepID=A0A1Y1IKV8_KLENI|nr:Arylamine N-acetyltransferase [Klebsormidium nitens]|eukprot:GAQ88718.1 Arylamine N-acetyltransferase [Klebsormidium nitens]